MAFKGKSKLSTVQTETSKPVIKVSRNDNTTGSSPLTFRTTDQEKMLLQNWLAELQQHTNKRLTTAKLLRGLIHMQQQINPNKLLESILENT